jgi:hypothetical protein
MKNFRHNVKAYSYFNNYVAHYTKKAPASARAFFGANGDYSRNNEATSIIAESPVATTGLSG